MAVESESKRPALMTFSNVSQVSDLDLPLSHSLGQQRST